MTVWQAFDNHPFIFGILGLAAIICGAQLAEIIARLIAATRIAKHTGVHFPQVYNPPAEDAEEPSKEP